MSRTGQPSRGKSKRLRTRFSPLHTRPAYRSGGLYGGQVLGAQARLLPPGTDVLNTHRAAGDDGEGEGSAQHLSSTFSIRAVN